MKSMTLAALCAAVLPLAAGARTYQLEFEDGGLPMIVGEDGFRRPVVIVEPEHWDMVTNHAFREIARLAETEDGRIRLHGPRKQQIVNDGEREVATVYEDGFVHVEKMRNRSRPVVTPKATQAEKEEKRAAYSRKYMEMLEARARGVTVDHDATTGKDTVK